MREQSPASEGSAHAWLSLARSGLAGIATTVFTGDGSTERFQSVGTVLSLVILYVVCVPRERWAKETTEPGTAAGAPMWHRRITPFLCGAGAAYGLAATLVGHWHTAAFVAVGLSGACATLVTRPGEPTTGPSTGQKRTAFALLAVGVTILIPAVLVGDWGSPVILVFCLGLVGVSVATDGRSGHAEPLART